ncbi:ParB N-terminal domain-containing protein [Loktanella sp. SALINAS62]|uniref:ParB/RepB/Spo0J family partition protein n=1 Tax=Loktanella sp. SALINAS62 TaxID=2706124 RepID=UPI001B8ADEF5|nr:ParB N-terminal domain-containing protein [Loktanella sp. SALINAS62]MBS1301756.1 ParB N-terminal domain-containing protein [Loktanella sp. SALINAS62]
MAKRKRLTPEPTRNPLAPAPETKTAMPRGLSGGRVPIADVAQDAASSAALAEVAQTLTVARNEGRLIQRLPLHLIDADHLVRDRIAADADEMTVLKDSIRERGQQTAIEVVALEGGRFGLISGWRRLGALRDLMFDTKDPAFETILAIVRTPSDAADAYVAMVEENEIRVGLSFYERARIVARSVDKGVFGSDRVALAQLFASVSRSKRSKIGNFVGLVRALDPVLRHPTDLTERSGLALAQALDADPALTDRLADALSREPARDAAQEARIITDTIMAPATTPAPPFTPADRPKLPSLRETLCDGLEYRVEKDGNIRLTGAALQNRAFVTRMLQALRDLDRA